MLGFDLHSWEQFMLYSLGLAAFAAVTVVVTTASVVISQRAENTRTKDEFETYKIQAAKQSDELRKQTAEANARAAEARLELEKFKSPRLLTEQQMRSILEQLPKESLNGISVGVTSQSVESVTLADQILRILQAVPLNASANSGAALHSFGTFFGVIVQYTTGNEPSKNLADALGKALNDVQITTAVVGGMHELVYSSSHMDRAGLGARNVLVAIGEKPL